MDQRGVAIVELVVVVELLHQILDTLVRCTASNEENIGASVCKLLCQFAVGIAVQDLAIDEDWHDCDVGIAALLQFTGIVLAYSDIEVGDIGELFDLLPAALEA